MQKRISLLLILVLALTMTVAGLSEDAPKAETATGSNILIAYFSRVGNTDFPFDTDASSSASVVVDGEGLVGNTDAFAKMIQVATGGDLFLIETAEKYPVSYDETIDVGSGEREANARPALNAAVENMDPYDTVFIGFPIWWYDMPMAVYTFLEAYDFSGKTVIPFATSGGSGFSGSIEVMRDMLEGAEVLDNGLLLSGSGVSGQQERVTSWVSELGLQ